MAALTLMLRFALLHMVTTTAIRSGELVGFSCTQQQMSGKYVTYDRVHGITFISKADGYLLVRSLGGESIVETGSFSEENGKELRSRSVAIMGHKSYPEISIHLADI